MRLAGSTILVCEDEAFIALEIEEALTSEGAVVLGPATHRAQAHDLIQHTTPDAAVLDLALADGHCTDVAEALASKGIPMAIVTGHTERNVPAIALDDARWFEKPYSPAEVVDYLVSAIQNKRAE